MILLGMIVLVWLGLAFLTVGALNVWKLVVTRPSESSINVRSAKLSTQSADQFAAG